MRYNFEKTTPRVQVVLTLCLVRRFDKAPERDEHVPKVSHRIVERKSISRGRTGSYNDVKALYWSTRRHNAMVNAILRSRNAAHVSCKVMNECAAKNTSARDSPRGDCGLTNETFEPLGN
ncbi:hypothetical protein WN51_01780 [Melipona quadrifasciata]|uniref:Uncharacterized protein n=1 Tax=Melipona quadrifasciata TaxID=166423 RepID=A0A0N0U4U2_9HYME|nr:hypothetical protein WN51_01780 [Melipona quadrifasciata]